MDMFKNYLFPVSGIEMKNRIVMAPMTTWSGNEDDSVSDAEIAYYHRRAKGVGAVITACAYVMPQGKAFSGQIGAHDDSMLPGLTRLASAIHEEGALAILQIQHGGRMSSPELLADRTPVSASAIAAVRENAVIPRQMTETEIHETIAAFGNATLRAILAGFDGVEIHGANTYLIQQFFSPHSNRRNDQWGGDVLRRINFPLNIVRTVKDMVQTFAKRPFLVGYRISPEEMENPGITIDDTLVLINSIVKEKLDYVHVSTMNFWNGSMRDMAARKPRTEIINRQFGQQVPIIGVGSVHTLEDADRIFNIGIPIVALGRELLMEPDWVQKVQNNQAETIRTQLDLGTQKELVIPDQMWHQLISREDWLPIKK